MKPVRIILVVIVIILIVWAIWYFFVYKPSQTTSAPGTSTGPKLTIGLRSSAPAPTLPSAPGGIPGMPGPSIPSTPSNGIPGMPSPGTPTTPSTPVNGIPGMPGLFPVNTNTGTGTQGQSTSVSRSYITYTPMGTPNYMFAPPTYINFIVGTNIQCSSNVWYQNYPYVLIGSKLDEEGYKNCYYQLEQTA